MTSELQIRRVRTDEAEVLRDIGLSTFIESFGPVNTPENIKNYTSKAFSLGRMKMELANPESEFYFAECGAELLGYLKLNFDTAQTEQGLGDSFEIERIYVQAKSQGRRVGKFLYEKALEIGRERKHDVLWLGVWDENHNAIGFYKKLGFESFGTHDFKLGTEDQTDLLMRLLINAD